MIEERAAECLEAGHQLSAYIDGELAPDEREALAAHLAACPACRARYQVDAAFVASLRRRREVPPVPATLRRRVLDALAEEHRREKT